MFSWGYQSGPVTIRGGQVVNHRTGEKLRALEYCTLRSFCSYHYYYFFFLFRFFQGGRGAFFFSFFFPFFLRALRVVNRFEGVWVRSVAFTFYL